jgi:hypothetical protein
VATIGKNHCIPSYWPSPAGVLCVDLTVDAGGLGVAYVYDWAGKINSQVSAQKDRDFQSGLSPSGQRYFMTPGLGIGAPAPTTKIIGLPALQGTTVAGHSACLWIDDDHLLAPDAVIAVQTTQPPATPRPTNVPPTATPARGVMTASVTALPARGVCAGNFPGGL